MSYGMGHPFGQLRPAYLLQNRYIFTTEAKNMNWKYNMWWCLLDLLQCGTRELLLPKSGVMGNKYPGKWWYCQFYHATKAEAENRIIGYMFLR